jgi:hypothetical protein
MALPKEESKMEDEDELTHLEVAEMAELDGELLIEDPIDQTETWRR